MLCKQCREMIEVGDAYRQEPSTTHGKYWYFHTGCHLEWRVAQNTDQVQQHLENLANAARSVH